MDYTYIGFTDNTSILFSYSISIACEKKSLKALVAEYVDTYGIGCYAENDEIFIIALLFYLDNILGIIICDIIDIDMMFTFI